MCHNNTSKNLGPAPKKIAAKYADDEKAQTMLEKKVRFGGSGSWGKLTMPATPKKVSDENIQIIVQWILAQK